MSSLNVTADTPLLQRVLDEVNQTPGIRQKLISTIEGKFGGRKVVTFFTSFAQPTIINDSDADMIEGVLQKLPMNNGLLLMINSAGGDPLAAERIVNICRSYSGGNFEVVVPKMAKSAATMICFGAMKIHMCSSAELGPMDPQITLSENGELKSFSVYAILQSYRGLLSEAVNTQGRIEPFLQQLSHFDPRLITEFEKIERLAEDIAVKTLKTGMMNTVDETAIKKAIEPFLNPEVGLSHGRPMYINQLQQCGIRVEEIPLSADTWESILELYIRSSRLLSSGFLKLVETTNVSYNVTV